MSRTTTPTYRVEMFSTRYPMTSNPMVSAHVYRDLSGAEQTLPRRAAMHVAKRQGGKVYRQAKDGRLLFVAAFVR